MRYYKSIGRKDLDEIAWEHSLLEKIREFADWVESRVTQLVSHQEERHLPEASPMTEHSNQGGQV
jgi:hypothetical protein